VRDLEALIGAYPRYPLPMGASKSAWTEQRQLGGVLLAILLLSLAIVSAMVPASSVSLHNILHHLNFLPLMIAGMLFGWRGAAIAAVVAGAVNAPAIVHHWAEWPMDAKDQIVELAIFSFAGLIAGYLSDRERANRLSLQKTQKELEDVYFELRENIAEMKKAERLSVAGQLAASLAHEIRNPLASISGAAGILQRGSAPPEYVHDSLEIIQKESQRLNKLLTGFLNFATPRSPRFQPTNIDELLDSVASLASHSAESKKISFLHPHPGRVVEGTCDPEQLKQVLLNLVINAIDASPAESQICLSARRDAGRVLIEVADAGSGIPQEAANRIFDPFFTTKTNGSGLGLAISSMIVSQHNGTLSFDRNPSGGTTFCIELPENQEHSHA
jgi:two-component system, NtrC family, sensor histidine kinase HydH